MEETAGKRERKKQINSSEYGTSLCNTLNGAINRKIRRKFLNDSCLILEQRLLNRIITTPRKTWGLKTPSQILCKPPK